MKIQVGFPECQRAEVARLFWEAFSGKLGLVLAPERKAKVFITRALCPENAIAALGDDGELLGIAGFKTRSGGLITAGFADLANVYGMFGALWRGPLLDLLERPLTGRQMLMDGLFVAKPARGCGVGTALIDALVAEGQRRGMAELRLDVIETNLRARALYERYGFVPTGRISLGVFSRLFGYHHATTMSLKLPRV